MDSGGNAYVAGNTNSTDFNNYISVDTNATIIANPYSDSHSYPNCCFYTVSFTNIDAYTNTHIDANS